MSPYSDMKMKDCLSGSLEIFSILSKPERASILLHNSIHHRTAFCLSLAFLFLVYFQSSPDKFSGSWQNAESRGDTVQSYTEQIYYSNYIPFPHSEVLARTFQLLAVHICPGLQIGCWNMFLKITCIHQRMKSVFLTVWRFVVRNLQLDFQAFDLKFQRTHSPQTRMRGCFQNMSSLRDHRLFTHISKLLNLFIEVSAQLDFLLLVLH